MKIYTCIVSILNFKKNDWLKFIEQFVSWLYGCNYFFFNVNLVYYLMYVMLCISVEYELWVSRKRVDLFERGRLSGFELQLIQYWKSRQMDSNIGKFRLSQNLYNISPYINNKIKYELNRKCTQNKIVSNEPKRQRLSQLSANLPHER